MGLLRTASAHSFIIREALVKSAAWAVWFWCLGPARPGHGPWPGVIDMVLVRG